MTRRQIAKVKDEPAFGVPPSTKETYQLYEKNERHLLQQTTAVEQHRTRSIIPRPNNEVAKWLDSLRGATVTAMPISRLVCDGEYLELRIEGEQSNMTLGWWTIEPEGAELLAAFAVWRRAP